MLSICKKKVLFSIYVLNKDGTKQGIRNVESIVSYLVVICFCPLPPLGIHYLCVTSKNDLV